MDNNVGFMSSLMLFFIRLLSFFTPITDVGRNIAISTYNKFTSGFERGIESMKDEPEDSNSEDGSGDSTEGEEHVDKGTSTAKVEETPSTTTENQSSEVYDDGNPPRVDGDQIPIRNDEDKERSDSQNYIFKGHENNDGVPSPSCECEYCLKDGPSWQSSSEDDSQDSDREQTGDTVIQNNSNEVKTNETRDTSDKPDNKVVREESKKRDTTAQLSESVMMNNIEEPRETPCLGLNDISAKSPAETPDNEECEPKVNPTRKDLPRPMHEIKSDRVSPKTQEIKEKTAVSNGADIVFDRDVRKRLNTKKQPLNETHFGLDGELSLVDDALNENQKKESEVGDEGKKEKS